MLVGSLLMAAGAFSICGAAMDWEWFMNHRKARLFVGLFGRNGARIAYAVLGAAFVVAGLLFATGVIQES